MRRPATRVQPATATTPRATSGVTSAQGTAGAPGRGVRWVPGAVLCATCALVIGIFAWSARSGYLEAQASGANNTYYNLLVQGFRAGRLELKAELPAGLSGLADPYDPIANQRYRYHDGNPLHDLSYYHGKLYLYFGVTPALVLFWPYAALTGHYLLHRDGVVIFCAVGFLASVGVLWGVWHRYFSGIGVGVVVAGVLALGLGTLVPVILPRCDVYEVAISCGYAMMMLALVAVWRALHRPEGRIWWLAGASLACGLAVGARPSLAFGVVILVVPVVQAWRERRPLWGPVLAATGPLTLVVLGLMLYNALRFSDPFEFGMRYALALPRMDTAQDFSWRYLGFNTWVYFLAPTRWSAQFPFVHDIRVPPLPAGHFGVEHPFGVLTNIPVVWLALAAPLAWRNRPAQEGWRLRGFLAAVAWLFGTCAFTLFLFFAACIRYQEDFVPALMLLAVVGIFGLERTLAGRPAWRRAARWVWGLLLAFSLAFNLLASINLQAGYHSAFSHLLFGRGQVNEAVVHLQTASRLQPDNAQVHYELGLALAAKGQMDEAISQFQTAIRLKPDFALAHFHLGAAFGSRGQDADSIHHFQEVIRLNPNYAEPHNNLGIAFARTGQVREAIQQYIEALRLKPNYPEVHNNLGILLVKTGQAGEGIRQFQEALRLKPDYADARKNLDTALAAGVNRSPPPGAAANR
jgi:Flp pilus assembly protein TadD